MCMNLRRKVNMNHLILVAKVNKVEQLIMQRNKRFKQKMMRDMVDTKRHLFNCNRVLTCEQSEKKKEKKVKLIDYEEVHISE